jgi:hypothetical protein
MDENLILLFVNMIICILGNILSVNDDQDLNLCYKFVHIFKH